MLYKQFFLFGVVGVLGFLVDAGVFYFVNTYIENLYVCRLLSYCCAVTTTWAVNRVLTFKKSFIGESKLSLLLEWAKFFISQGLGFFINYGTFSVLVFSVPLFAKFPLLAIAVGSIAGLGVNFLMAKFYIFRK